MNSTVTPTSTEVDSGAITIWAGSILRKRKVTHSCIHKHYTNISMYTSYLSYYRSILAFLWSDNQVEVCCQVGDAIFCHTLIRSIIRELGAADLQDGLGECQVLLNHRAVVDGDP